MTARGWDQPDVILISGDAYVDHPSFGHAVVGRLLEAEGLKVAILPQPNWRDDLRDFKKLGEPRLFFGVTSGCMDSMVNHYTANRRKRSNDAYTPGGNAGFRPDYALTVYSNILKKLYPHVPVVLGGIEASLRRVSHYDYWSDTIKPSVLVSSGADLLVYGMGERPLVQIAQLLKKGVPLSNIRTTLRQACYWGPSTQTIMTHKQWQDQTLPSHEDQIADPRIHSRAFKIIETESNRMDADRLLEPMQQGTVVINPPEPPLNSQDLDRSFDLPYTRLPHPRYRKRGPIPAYEMIKFSVNLHRGCFGGCAFCTISAHQGKFIASRSPQSILQEIDNITQMPDFKGTITDLGGPSANMYQMKGVDKERCQKCRKPSCIFPKVCSNLDTRHQALLDIYEQVRKHPAIKHVYIGSGIRYDLFLHPTQDKNLQKDHQRYLETLIQYHISGRLKVAPEHTSPAVLQQMRKPSFELFKSFHQQFEKINQQLGKKQQLIPYFISSHPGSDLGAMAELALETKKMGYQLEQVQDFTPTPMTISTAIYASGIHPYSGQTIFTATSTQEKLDQRRFFFWYQQENRAWIRKTLEKLKLGKISRQLLSRDLHQPGMHQIRGPQTSFKRPIQSTKEKAKPFFKHKKSKR